MAIPPPDLAGLAPALGRIGAGATYAGYATAVGEEVLEVIVAEAGAGRVLGLDLHELLLDLVDLVDLVVAPPIMLVT